MVIYAFGDSITYGCWDIRESGWADLLRKHIDGFQKKNPEYWGLLYNLGIPGDTTAGLVKRFKYETDARVRESKGQDALFIFAFGANDAAFAPAENKFKVSKEDFKANLREVIDAAMNISKNILLINILPVVEKTAGIPRYGYIRSNKFMEEYNAVLEELSLKFGIRLVDVHSVFMKAGHEKLLVPEDGLHPNEHGHRLIFETIRPVVLKMIGWD